MKFVFSHGFGFDSDFWYNLRPYFAEYECIYLDQGYFGHEKKFASLDSNDTTIIGIGHSLGFQKLLSLPISFTKLVGLQGFINFLGFNQALRQKRSIELTRLKSSFALSHLITLENFYQRCGLEHPYPKLDQINKRKLAKELDNITQIYQPIQIPTLIVGAKDDKIVPHELIEDNFASQPSVKTIILDQGKHSLGYHKVAEIHRIIMNFVSDNNYVS